MGWFDDQINQRIQNDNETFSRAFADMASAVMGKNTVAAEMNDKRRQTMDAVGEILSFYRVESRELPDSLVEMNEVLEFLLRPSGIMHRNVELKDKWYQDGIGPMLVNTKDGKIAALIPSGVSGYSYFDNAKGKKVKVNKKNADNFETEAIAFYKPLPLKSLKIKDLLIYIKNSLSAFDFIMIILSTLAVTGIGTLMAYANNIIFDKVIVVGKMSLFYAALVLITGVALSTQLVNITKNLITSRIETKSSISVESAVMMRVLSLPAAFFKQYSSGNLSSRVRTVGTVCQMMISVIFSTGLSALFSLVYFVQIFHYAAPLTVPAVLVLLLALVFFTVTSLIKTKLVQKEIDLSTKENGLIYALLSGVQKLKLTGAEKRAFVKWSEIYSEKAKVKYDPPLFVKLLGVITSLILSAGLVVIYFAAVKSGVKVADYMSFNVAYGMVSSSLMMISVAVTEITYIKPMLESVEPILQEVPEISPDKRVVTKLSGGIELSNISFRYDKDMPLVIDNLSLKIRPGQYVAIVGSTGCGKSTLMRLMLGFESPQKGAVYYDGKNIDTLDLKSLRHNIGTVMQNSKLFSGDIYSNIVISAPYLTVDDAWKAAEMSGIADDIRDMPMGMSTYISEGAGGISGGQRQRLMIARAIAPKPKILMFDEATSALDNITQKMVSDSLDSLKCTRIVIAHRLSTIKQCDRIIVLNGGKIVEDGTYNELIDKKGFFAELVERQQLGYST